ncbi:PAS domain S-box protein [Vampirovibrio sp.]|uniref:PAS domain S-box protein n=1 Tax=Vampirovibrio sp. TaxID=2717857 RepID=UPI0035941974
MVVFTIGAASLIGIEWNIPLLKSFTLTPYKDISFHAAICFLCMGASMMLDSRAAVLKNGETRKNRILFQLSIGLLVVTLSIALSNMVHYFYLSRFQILQPLVQDFPQIPMAFLTAIQLLLASMGLLLLQRFPQSWWCTGLAELAGLFILESTIFAFIGHWFKVPVLFSFIQALPTGVALIGVSSALLQYSIASGGVLSPLFSPALKIKGLSWIGLAAGLLIALAGLSTINLFQAFMPQNMYTAELVMGFEFSTIALSILVIGLSLKLAHFFENSLQAETLAKISETRFRLLVSAVQDYAIYMLDPHGIITTWNEGGERIQGYSASEIMGQHFSVFYTDSEKACDLPTQHLKAALEQKNLELNHWSLRKNGTLFWAKCTITALFSPEGTFIGFSKVIQDLTRQKNMEESLRASILELTHIRQALDAASIVVTTDNKGVITNVNQAFCTISLYSKEELIGQTHQLVNSGYHPPSFFQGVWQTINQGKIWKGEFKNRAKNGSFYWVDSTIYPFMDENNVPVRYIAIHHDITPLKTAQESLKANAYRQKILSHLSQHALSGIEIDPLLAHATTLTAQALETQLCTVLALQPSGQEFLLKAGWGWKKDLVGQALIPAGLDSQAGFALLMDEPVIVEDIRTETRFKAPDLLLAHQAVSGVSVIIHGEAPEKPYGVLSVHTTQPRHFETEEVTFLQAVSNIIAIAIERKNAEMMLRQFNEMLEKRVAERTQELEATKREAEEANRLKSEVLAFVAHDFKNPLSAMARFIQILSQQAKHLTPNQQQMLNYISEGTAQLRAMVTDILDKARMDAGQLILNLEWIAIQNLLDGLMPVIQVLAEDKGITVDYDIQPDLLGIEADPRFLPQIILNLVSNAIKYNKKEGQVWLRIQEASNSQFVKIEVQDTGVGIPAEKIPEIFEQYFRGGTASYDHVEGTGLGLAYTKKLIDMHGGQLEVRSEVGVGSTFVVLLPNSIPVALRATLNQFSAKHLKQE